MKEKFQRKEEKNERQSGLVEEATQNYLYSDPVKFFSFWFCKPTKNAVDQLHFIADLFGHGRHVHP